MEIRFAVRLTPRGGVNRIEGTLDGTLCVRVAAPPVGDAANRALVRLLASDLGVPVSAVRIVSGATGRRKVVAADGLDRPTLLARWPDLGL